jgi:folate-binding protein YgfZ
VTTADFGDVTGEYLALRSGAGIVSPVHDLVWVRGPDAVRFLDGLLSRAVERMEAGSAGRSLLLSPQGKLRATLWLLAGSTDEVGIVTDPGRGAVVVEDLNRFRIRVDAEVGVEPAPVLGLWGPTAASVLGQAGKPIPATERWIRDADGSLIAALPFTRSSLPRFAMVGMPEEALVSAGATRVGHIAVTAVRVEAGEPMMGIDLDEKTIPQEGGVVEGAVDFDKGCYLGQELVARIDSRGHVNRGLRGVVFSSNVLVPPGSDIVHEGKSVGAITSVAESLELRAPVGLALIRREVEPGTQVSVRWQGGETSARVAEVPLDPTLGGTQP